MSIFKRRVRWNIFGYETMSLFQVREWWHAKGEHDEEYTCGALLVGNVDNDTTGHGTLCLVP